MYGSAVNGMLVSSSSDLDLTILVDDYDVDQKELLGDVKRVLLEKKGDMFKIPNYMPRRDNSGWILEFDVKDEEHGSIVVQLMVNKKAEIMNS